MKGFALGLASKQRRNATRKSPIRAKRENYEARGERALHDGRQL